MTALTKPRMNVDEFLSWAVDQPGRYELFRGEVYAMSPETVGHAKVKGAVYAALLAAVGVGAFPDLKTATERTLAREPLMEANARAHEAYGPLYERFRNGYPNLPHARSSDAP